MKMKIRMQGHRLLMISALVSTVMLSCEKNNDDVKSPSQEIHESEGLIIPAIVDLPANQPGGNKRVATYYAKGVQKYKAQQVAGDPSKFEWVFVAPSADLYDVNNKKVGTHTAGPTWQLFGSGDSIYAQHATPQKNVASPLPNTIDWLLLIPKTGKTPTGIFSNVDYIQRIATRGGKAPTIPPTHIGQTTEVHYTAVYRFSSMNP